MKAKELKKYKFLKDLGNYKKGEIVEFYEDDAIAEKLLKNKLIVAL